MACTGTTVLSSALDLELLLEIYSDITYVETQQKIIYYSFFTA